MASSLKSSILSVISEVSYIDFVNKFETSEECETAPPFQKEYY